MFFYKSSFRWHLYFLKLLASNSDIQICNRLQCCHIQKVYLKFTFSERRRVGVSDLSSSAEIQGFLFQRLRSRHNQNVHWERRWFVLLGNCLYGFRTKDDTKAACLIFLSGFTVAVASEVTMSFLYTRIQPKYLLNSTGKIKVQCFQSLPHGNCFLFLSRRFGLPSILDRFNQSSNVA